MFELKFAQSCAFLQYIFVAVCKFPSAQVKQMLHHAGEKAGMRAKTQKKKNREMALAHHAVHLITILLQEDPFSQRPAGLPRQSDPPCQSPVGQ